MSTPYTDTSAAGESVGYDAYALPEKPHWGPVAGILTGCIISLAIWALIGWLALG
jgi:hypothetical protein